jgi:hypothetical protein
MISVLDAIEQQLVQAAELHLTGTLTEALYISTLRGALAVLPTSEAPGHISVLKRLKKWKEGELIPEDVHQQLSSLTHMETKV